MLVCRYHLHYHRIEELRSTTLLKVFYALDVFRRPQRFKQWLQACEADARGRGGNKMTSQSHLWQKLFTAVCEIRLDPEEISQLSGLQIAEKLRRQRLRAIREIRAR
ncbi:MAG: hypothetical protein KZQ58_12600 [gamma proteobacterium symbiont of Bathyaustriella thionipta]|nr:hypothetical protein [gamma proteobacterium symbiont of Bathyaustriella thionipta]